MPTARRAGTWAVLAGVPLALAYRFAILYRTRAGFPRRYSPHLDPSALGLPFEAIVVDAPSGPLPAWFIPARGGEAGPGVVLVHGWESARHRSLPNAEVLHAAGFHVLAFDVRGHGDNPAEALPISAGEFGIDTAAAVDALLDRPEVTTAGILGHSMGGAGALLAAAADRRVAAVATAAAPAGPYRLTRLTFRLARLPLPDPIAYPLAALTTHVFVRPRGHAVRRISTTRAAARYRGPLLLVQGDADTVVPRSHLEALWRAARAGRRRPGAIAPERAIIAGGEHSWLYEHEAYRREVARFLASALGGPYPPAEAADRAAAVDAKRLPEEERWFAAVEEAPSRLRAIAELLGARPRRVGTAPIGVAATARRDGGPAADARSWADPAAVGPAAVGGADQIAPTDEAQPVTAPA